MVSSIEMFQNIVSKLEIQYRDKPNCDRDIDCIDNIYLDSFETEHILPAPPPPHIFSEQGSRLSRKQTLIDAKTPQVRQCFSVTTGCFNKETSLYAYQ